MVVTVFASKSLLNKFQPAISMTVLALNDILALFSLVMNNNTYWTHFKTLSEISYKLFVFMQFYFQVISCWLTAFINLERVLTLWYRGSKRFNSVKFKIFAILFIHVWNFLNEWMKYVFSDFARWNAVRHGLFHSGIAVKIFFLRIIKYFLLSNMKSVYSITIKLVKYQSQSNVHLNSKAMP